MTFERNFNMKYKPIKTLESTKYGNNRWTVFSPKINREVQLFSDLEYYNWLQVETNPQIIDFCEQPLKVEACLNGQKRFSIPDMIVEDIDHTFTLIEVKHQKELRSNRVQNQIKIQEYWSKKNNIKHTIFTDEILDNKWYLLAWKKIIQSVASTDKRTLVNQINKIIAIGSNDSMTIGQIIDTLDSPNQTLNAIFLMIYEGRIEFNNLSKKISRSTEVIING